MADACRFGLTVVVDLAHITFIDCSGLALLLSVRKELAASGRTLNIVNASPRVKWVFTLTNLEHLLTAHRLGASRWVREA